MGVYRLGIYIDLRERFRNPPAHNKYLALSSVSACKEYVEDQLLNLNKWVKTTE